MTFLKNYYSKTIKKDLINKFNFKNVKNVPCLKKIVVNFGHNSTDLKITATHLLALELITNKRGTITQTKKPNILLKIRKNHPVGAKVCLKKNDMFEFTSKLINEVIPKLKNFKGFNTLKKSQNNTLSFRLYDALNFNELESHYNLFNKISKMNVTLTTNLGKKDEVKFLLKSMQIEISKMRL